MSARTPPESAEACAIGSLPPLSPAFVIGGNGLAVCLQQHGKVSNALTRSPRMALAFAVAARTACRCSPHSAGTSFASAQCCLSYQYACCFDHAVLSCRLLGAVAQPPLCWPSGSGRRQHRTPQAHRQRQQPLRQRQQQRAAAARRRRRLGAWGCLLLRSRRRAASSSSRSRSCRSALCLRLPAAG
jgi:hypothetical protein